MARNNMTWEEFATKVQAFQVGFMGAPKEVQPGRGEFHENPASCICENEGTETIQKETQEEDHENDNNGRDTAEVNDEQDPIEEDLDWIEDDYSDNIKDLPDTDSNVLTKQEQPEVEELFSD